MNTLSQFETADIAAFVAQMGAKGLVVTAAGLLLYAALARHASAAARHLVLALALCGLVLLPVLFATMPSLEVPWPRMEAEPAPSAALPVAGPATLAPPAETPAHHNSAPSTSSTPSIDAPLPARTEASAPVDWPRVLLLAWLAGAALASFPILLGAVALARRRPGASLVLDGPLLAMVREACASLGIRRHVALLTCEENTIPVTWGVLRPVVALPREAADWPEERLRAVLYHELAHVRRGDWLLQLLGRVACAIHWYNPLAWTALHLMRKAAERACDDEVLRSGSRATAYAEHLLVLARSLRAAGPASLAIAMARTQRVEARIKDILSLACKRGRVSRRVLAVSAAVALLAVAAIGALAPEGDAAQEQALSRGERQNLLKEVGLALKIHANKARGAMFPPKAPISNAFYPDLGMMSDALEQVNDPERVKAYLCGELGPKPVYLGYAVTNEDELVAVLDANSWTDDVKHAESAPGAIMRLREGVERFFITDINNPAASAIAQSKIPVVWEMPDATGGDGGNVLYMDGHVEYWKYPGKFPMTEETMVAIRKAMNGPAVETPRASWSEDLLVPKEWPAERRERLVKRSDVLNEHSETYMGMTIGHAELTLFAEDLEAILQEKQAESDNFSRGTNGQWTEHAFGETSGASFDKNGQNEAVPWWKPAGRQDVEYVSWILDAQPVEERVSLQLSEAGEGKRHVYLRYESARAGRGAGLGGTGGGRRGAAPGSLPVFGAPLAGRGGAVRGGLLEKPPATDLSKDDRVDLLKHAGLVLKIAASQAEKETFPPKTPKAGAFWPDADAVAGALEELDADSNVDSEKLMAYLRGELGPQPVYTGFTLLSEEAGLALLQRFGAFPEDQSPIVQADARMVSDGDLGPKGGIYSILRLKEGIGGYFITDIHNPAATAQAQSEIPVIWEMPDSTPDGGSYILFMDGHVEYREFPEAFPLSPAFIETIREQMASARATAGRG